MNVNIPAQFRGTYDFTLRRKDGTVQRETVHNIATSNIATTIGVSTLLLVVVVAPPRQLTRCCLIRFGL